jgi:hypothetical protein
MIDRRQQRELHRENLRDDEGEIGAPFRGKFEQRGYVHGLSTSRKRHAGRAALARRSIDLLRRSKDDGPRL